ncbi:MAG: glycosyltransferase family 2 protein [Bacteroidaceae bacterium]|nr:glycosyltransferase family 2 protein [Bacteroidaceae bacterium]
MKKTAVVILNYNGAEMLRRFLPGVLLHSGPDRVIVADNASTDRSLEVLSREFPAVPVIRLDQNYGFAEGYNQALAQVEAEYVVLLNNDVEVTANWLAPLEEYMDSHPEAAACQPKIRSYRNKERFEYAGAAGGFIDRYGYPFCRGRVLDCVEQDHGQYDDITEVFWATGAALFIRLEDYRRAGGLDGRFFAHMEEIDLCWRLRSRGRKIACVPRSVVFHVGGATLSKDNARKTFLNFRNNLLMLYKNLPESELRPVLRTRTLLDFIALVQFILKMDFPNARAVWKARQAFRQMKPDFAKDRETNLKQTIQSVIPERMRGLLLWDFYIQRKRTFSSLRPSAH